MEVKTVVLFCVVLLCAVQKSFSLPKDSTFQVDNELRAITDAENVQSETKTTENAANPVVMINGRLWCESEEASEDEACQAHCLPKGYSYGICVSNSCSCI